MDGEFSSRPVIRNRMGFQSRERNRESTGKGSEIRGDNYIIAKNIDGCDIAYLPKAGGRSIDQLDVGGGQIVRPCNLKHSRQDSFL